MSGVGCLYESFFSLPSFDFDLNGWVGGGGNDERSISYQRERETSVTVVYCGVMVMMGHAFCF